ncbi:hypothetical protein M2169_003445 [Streptomyces sp. MJP52]|nr:hypothetical protein [Streptomyces sp. MJP52]
MELRIRRPQQSERVRIELLKRVWQVRILPGHSGKGRFRRGPDRSFAVSGVVPRTRLSLHASPS